MAGVGSTLGPYELLAELGRGAMGVVYRARRSDLNRDFALKVIAPGQDAAPEALERFRREAQAAGTLSGHPGIVGVHDIGEAEGQVYFAMDLVEGESMDAAIDAGDLAPEAAARLVAAAARAVHHAHEHGILHRDLKPGNIMIGADGAARVADFGLAQTQRADAQSARLTRSGTILGTPAYMPPEQAAGDRLDRRADVYALGATLYEALAGRPPFESDTLYGLLAQIQREDPVPLRRLSPSTPLPLEIITGKCLEKEPDRRYDSAAALAADLERWLAGESISASPPSAAFRLRRAVQRRKGLAIGLAVAVLLAGGITAWLLPQLQEASSRADAEAEAAAASRARAAQANAAVRAEQRDKARAAAELACESAIDMWRAGERERAGRYAEQLRDACATLRKVDPASPLADILLANTAVMMERFEQAEAHAAHALERDPGAGQAHLVRLQSAWRRYADRGRTLHIGADDPTRAGRTPQPDQLRSDAEAQALAAEIADAVTAVEAHTDDVSDAELATARGIAAWTDGDLERAADLLGSAVKSPNAAPAAYEALGYAMQHRGQLKASLAVWDDAVAKIGGSRALQVGRAAARLLAVIVVRRVGGDASSTVAAALEAFEGLAEREPREIAWRMEIGLLCADQGGIAAGRGEDPGDHFKQAFAHFDAAEQLAPNDFRPPKWRGSQRAKYAKLLQEVGYDTRAEYARAVADLSRAAELAPNDFAVWRQLGYARMHLADRRFVRGGVDPREEFARADRELERARSMQPGRSSPYESRALLHRLWAMSAPTLGADPEPLFRKSIEYLGGARERTGESHRARLEFDLGMTYADWTRSRWKRNLDASEHFTRAQDALGRAGAHRRFAVSGRFARGQLRFELALRYGRLRKDPRPLYISVIKEMDEIQRIKPKFSRGLTLAASAYTNLGNAGIGVGVDPGPFYREAAERLAQVMLLRPGSPQPWADRGKVHFSHFGYLSEQGRPAHDACRAAIRDFTEAIRLKSKEAAALRKYRDGCERYLREHPEKR